MKGTMTRKGCNVARALCKASGAGVIPATQAEEILGRGYIGVAAGCACNFYFSHHDRVYLCVVAMTEDELLTCQQTHILVAVPAGSLVEHRQIMDTVIHSKQSLHYLYEHEHEDGFHEQQFATERGEAEWWLIRRQLVSEKQTLLNGECAVSARAADYSIFMCAQLLGERLFWQCEACCCDRLKDGRQVALDNFNRTFPFFSYHIPNQSQSNVSGVIVGRKLELKL